MSEVNWDDFTPAGQTPAAKANAVDWSQFEVAEPPKPKGFLGQARDLGLSAVKSAIAVPELAVGLGDLASGGRVGKFLENEGGSVGFRPKQAKDYLSSFETDQLKAQRQEFSDADGVMAKTGVALTNPALIANTVTESIAPMFAGGVVGRGVKALAPAVTGATAAGIGEGAVMAGSAAEQMRQQTADGLLTGKQTALAAGTGVVGAVIGAAGNKLGQAFGDVDSMIVDGLGRTARATAAPAARSMPARILGGGAVEGAEELGQSVPEQVFQNEALGRPLDEGVADAAVMGTLAGVAMGGGAGAIHGAGNRTAAAPPPGTQQPPAADPSGTPGTPPATPPGPQTAPPPSTLTPDQSQAPAPDAPADLPPQAAQPQPSLLDPALSAAQSNIDRTRTEWAAAAEQRAKRMAAVGVADPAPNSPLTNAAIVAVDSGAHDLAVGAQMEQSLLQDGDRAKQSPQPPQDYDSSSGAGIPAETEPPTQAAQELAPGTQTSPPAQPESSIPQTVAPSSSPVESPIIQPDQAGYKVQGVDEAIQRGASSITVSNNGQPVPFNTFVVSVEGDTAQVASVERASDSQGGVKGSGFAAYVALGNELAARGVTLTNGDRQNAPGAKLWRQLTDAGYARRRASGKGFEFVASNAQAAPAQQTQTPAAPIAPAPTTQERIAALSAEIESGTDTATGAPLTGMRLGMRKAQMRQLITQLPRDEIEAARAKYDAPAQPQAATPTVTQPEQPQGAANEKASQTQPQQTQPEAAAGAVADAAQGVAQPAPRPANWQKNRIQAGSVARSAGIDTAGMGLPDIVAAVERTDSAIQAESDHIGMNNQPLAEGGKPFKFRRDAKTAQKLNPTMRVISAGNEFVLTKKTPAQLAQKRSSVVQTSPRGEPIPAHAFIASAGGLAASARAELRIGVNPRVGMGHLFAGKGRTGLTLDQATERLIEDGYLSASASPSDAAALIKRSLTSPQYTPDGWTSIAEREADAERAAYMRQDEPQDGQQAQPDDWLDDYSAAYQDALAEVQALDDNEFAAIDDSDIPFNEGEGAALTGDAAMRAMGFTEQEIQEINNEAASRQGITPADSQGREGAIEAAAGPAQEADGQRAPAQSQEQGLSAPQQASTESVATPVTPTNPNSVIAKAKAAKAKKKPTLRESAAQASTPSGRDGYDTSIELDAAALKAIIEKTRGESLVDKPAKLEAWRTGTAKTDTAKFPIELGFTRSGELNVNDGRHRIALAAERGETVIAFIDGKDAQRAVTLVNANKSAPADTLTTPTAQDIITQQERAEAAAKAEKSQQRAADELARRERERKDIARASKAAADTFTLGGDAEQNLSGQGSVFDEPAPAPKAEAAPEPATQAAAILDAANITGKERIDAIKDVKKGEVTPEELEAAYPAVAAPEDESPASSTLNKAHTISKARALTSAGSLKADATNSAAPSSVWYYQGDMGNLQFTANVTMNGEPEKGAQAAKAMLAQIKSAQAAGWKRRNMRAGKLGTVWVYEKGDQFLTRAGMENAAADVLHRPDMPKSEAGYENMVQRQAALAKAFSSWLGTLTESQQANRALVTRKMNETPVSEWARITDDKSGLSLQYLEPTGQWSIQISAPSFDALMEKVRGTTPAPAPQTTTEQGAAPAEPTPTPINPRSTPNNEAARAAYYTPGHVILSHTGTGNDEVLSYTPQTAEKSWSVKVQPVKRINGKWEKVGRAVTHHNLPNYRNMAVGNVRDLDGGVVFSRSAPKSATPKTGKPITLFYVRNTASLKSAGAPNMDFGQKLEPAGEYMNVDQVTELKPPSSKWEAGTINFKNPLVLEHKSTDSTGWKKDLSDQFGGKTGKALSKAIMAAGYDGIITYDKYGLSETVNLSGEKQPAAFSRSPASTPGMAPAQVQAITDRIAANWTNAPEIIVAANMADERIPKAARDEDQRQRSMGATGSPEGFVHDGKVYLLADQLTSPSRAAEVLLHEALGHIGLAGAFGDSLKPILQQIATMRRADVTAKAKQYGLNMADPADRLLAAEEVLAEMAQATPQIGFVKRAIAAIRNWLRANIPGFKSLGLTDADISQAYLLPARGWIERGVAGRDGGSAAFSRGAARPELITDIPNETWLQKQIASAKAKGRNAFGAPRMGSTTGRFKGVVQVDVKMLAKLSGLNGEQKNIRPASLAWLKNEMDKNGLKNIGEPYIEVGYDGIPWVSEGNHRIMVAQELGWQYMPVEIRYFDGGERVSGDLSPGDVMAGSTPMFSRSPAAAIGATPPSASWDSPEPSQFDNLVYKLQDKQIDTKRVVESIRATAGALADSLDVYLQEELFHGRAAARSEDFLNKELAPLINTMRMSGLSIVELDEYLHARHAKEANELIADRNPDIQDGGSGMTTQAAADYLASLAPQQRSKLDAAAARVDAILAGTRQLYANYGLESDATVQGWGSMFKHYVPLMRDDKDGGMGIGQGFSIKGRETKSRTGSTRKVVDILANIAMQRERAIVRGEKNRVAASLVGLVQANPNKEFWQVGPPPKEKVYDPKTNTVVERADPMYKSRENVIVAKIKKADGSVVEKAVVFSEDDPRAVRMAAALKNLDAAQLEGVLGVSAKITRYFAAINTQYNPIFGVVNITRDVQGAILNLSSTPLKGKGAQVAKHVISALAGVYMDARAAREGKAPTSPWGALFEEFKSQGGQTGFRNLFENSDDRANAIRRELNPTAWMDSPLGKVFTADGALKVPLAIAQKRATGVFDWLSDYNLAMENAVRLSAYKVGIEQGMSKQQAASLAKNLTVNFNRKGQVGQQAGALYAFFNAAMQGTARLGATLFTMEPGKPKTTRLSASGKKIVYGGVLLGVMQALLLSAAGFDDEEPPDFVRERSLIIPTGGKSYITIPMPLGLHVLPNIGRMPTEFALSGFKDPEKRIARLLSLVTGAFNPVGGGASLVQMLSPTAADPLVAIAENKDWTGKPIAKTAYNQAIPGHALAKDTASKPAKLLAEAINTISGGTEYTAGVLSPTPDQIDYLWGQATGGVGRELNKVQQTTSAMFSGEELPAHKIPLAGRFYGNAEAQSAQSTKFYSSINRLNRHEEEIKGLRKDGRGAEVAGYMAENPDARLFMAANAAERVIQDLRGRKRALLEKDAPAERVKEMERLITDRMTRFNELVKRAQERSSM